MVSFEIRSIRIKKLQEEFLTLYLVWIYIKTEESLSSTNPSVQHLKTYFEMKGLVVLNWGVCWTEGFLVLNWRIFGAEKAWPWGWTERVCVELRVTVVILISYRHVVMFESLSYYEECNIKKYFGVR